MAGLDCPECGLFNPGNAMRCDCGFDFGSRKVEQSFVQPSERERIMPRPTHSISVNGFGVALYGRMNEEPLAPAEGEKAKLEGYSPVRYQAVQWVVFAFVPIVPLGSYWVTPRERKIYEGVEHRMTPAPWNRKQVLLHYCMGWSWLVLLAFFWR